MMQTDMLNLLKHLVKTGNAVMSDQETWYDASPGNPNFIAFIDALEEAEGVLSNIANAKDETDRS